jgi:hypothetical protein
MSASDLQEAICQTTDAIHSSIIADRHNIKYEKILVEHLKYLLEAQRRRFSDVNAGKIVWNEEEQT